MAAGAMAGDASIRKNTDMEALNEKLGNILSRLRSANEQSATILDRFHGTPVQPSPAPSIQTASPAPGTLAGLQEIANYLSDQADSAENVATRLRSTF